MIRASETIRRRPTMATARRWVGAAALSLALGPLAGCGGGEEEVRAPSAEVTRGRIERIVVATGTIEPSVEVEVRPRIAGIIEKIHVEAGDRVEQGQPLVEIERQLLASQTRESEAALKEARVEAHYAKVELDRALELERTGAASPRQGDEARARHERALAAVLRAEASAETLRTQLGYATVISPLAGRVLHVPVEEGSAVSPVTAVTGGTLLLNLAATQKLHLEGLVDENEVARVQVGQPARIRTEAFGERVLEGRVRKIAPLGERIQNVTYFEIEIEVTDPRASDLRPRMSGDGRIVTEVVDDALLIPETALRYRGDALYVEIEGSEDENGADPEERSVEIGIVEGGFIQVTSGLSEGERVRIQ